MRSCWHCYTHAYECARVCKGTVWIARSCLLVLVHQTLIFRRLFRCKLMARAFYCRAEFPTYSITHWTSMPLIVQVPHMSTTPPLSTLGLETSFRWGGPGTRTSLGDGLDARLGAVALARRLVAGHQVAGQHRSCKLWCRRLCPTPGAFASQPSHKAGGVRLERIRRWMETQSTAEH